MKTNLNSQLWRGILFILVIILVMLSGTLYGKNHPEIKWQELTSPHFVVVYPQGYEETATYTLKTADEILPQLLALWGDHIQIRGPIRILLTDRIDDANGSATFLPYNQVEIFLYNPPPDTPLGGFHDWIRAVLPHELTHILYYNSGSGFTYWARRLLGFNPLLFPFIYSPTWMLEGLSIYAESELDAGGRLHTPDFTLWWTMLAQEQKLAPWAGFWNAPKKWPGNMANYLYGAGFVRFLAQKYGVTKLKEWVRLFTRYPLPVVFKKGSGPFPLTLQNRFHQVFGQSIEPLWQEFCASLNTGNEKKPISPALHMVTDSGFYKKYPILVQPDLLLYIEENPREYPGIYTLNLKTNKSKCIHKQHGISGCFYDFQTGALYFSANEYNKSYYDYSDLYRLNLTTKKLDRLTKGKRLSYPVKGVAEDVYCIKRVQAHSFLCRWHGQTGQEEILSEGFAGLAFPDLSPAGDCLAVSVKENQKNWRIALFDLKGRLLRYVTDGSNKCYYPKWRNEQELFFISEYQQGYYLTKVKLNENTMHIYNQGVPALHSFHLVPSGGEPSIWGSFFAVNGLNLGYLKCNEREAETRPLISHEILSPIRFPETQKKGSAYRFLRELRPFAVDFSYRDGGQEFRPGILLQGSDVLARHRFSLEGFYGFSSRKPGFRFQYTFDRFYPTFSFSYEDLSDYLQGQVHDNYISRQQKVQVAVTYPLFLRHQNQSYLYGDVHWERIKVSSEAGASVDSLHLNGIKLGLFYNSAKRYVDAISASDGIRFSLSYGREFKFLGSDYNIHTAALEYKQYVALARPNVLAFRLAFLHGWGQARRRVVMGGVDDLTGFHVVGNDLFTLLRGYPSGYFDGSGGVLANLEYRLSLFRIDRTFWLFSSLQRVYSTIFIDTGNLWDKNIRISPAFSVGAEINIIAFIGDYAMNLSAGLAWGWKPQMTVGSTAVYFRIGSTY